jgi:nicotinamide mononucleotide transporter
VTADGVNSDARPRYLGAAVIASAVAALLLSSGWFWIQVPWIESLATVTGAWSVFLLSRNNPAGWFVGLVSVVAFGWVFFGARLYAEVGIQIFYFGTSIYAIYLWRFGGEHREERPVRSVPPRLVMITVPICVASLVVLRLVLVEINGAAPFWDALTTIMSLTAHIYLMWRFVESWYLWIAVDVIYVPLYLSRGLRLTALLYVAFLVMSIAGLIRFRELVRPETVESIP